MIKVGSIHKNTIHSVIIQFRASLKVAKGLNFDEAEACYMRDREKFVRSSKGELVRPKNKMPVKLFPSGTQ